MPARSAGEPQARARVDNLPGMHCRAHRRIAARAGDVEQAESFHEEGPLLTEERREALVDLDLELVAFDLAEVRVVGGVERDCRCHTILHAHPEISARPRAVPPRDVRAPLLPGEGPAWNCFEQPAGLQLVKYDRAVRLKD